MRDGYLFDLDGTLVDTSSIYDIRQQRLWRDCVDRVHETVLFPGVSSLLQKIRESGAKIAIVTTSVSFYAEAMARFHNLPHDALVAYHDVRRRKPEPDCFVLALAKLALEPDASVGIGDDVVDCDALLKAGIVSVAAAWNLAYHASAPWDVRAFAPHEVLDI